MFITLFTLFKQSNENIQCISHSVEQMKKTFFLHLHSHVLHITLLVLHYIMCNYQQLKIK